MIGAETALDLERTLHERFGLEEFRPGQREVIENVLAGKDVLCVMPTGGGKSLCYQLPALLLRGPTLVISPLIALMKDQVDALTQRGLRATLINSTLDAAEQHARILEIQAGRYDLIYVAPERFRSQRFVEVMAKLGPALLAVDEAHCISEWGHDFRPDYAKIGKVRRRLGSPPCIALTATATDLVRRDIAEQLDLQDPAQFVTGFDRPNLSYAVVETRRDAEKLSALADILEKAPGPAVIYASSRARCEMIGTHLERELKRSTVVYHAGLSREDRTSAQDRFMRGEVETVVATNAFGMGVDKSDIRSVIHFNLPGTLEAYYQEAGRAGRDRKAAQCVLLFSYSDRFLQEMFIENEYPSYESIYAVYDFLRARSEDPIELTHAEIAEAVRADVNESSVGTCLKIIESAGGIERFLPRENMAIIRINSEGDEPSLEPRLGNQARVQRIVLLGLEGIVNRRYGEAIYFQPQDLATTLGLERSALDRAVKALASSLPIDYVPPFRGNAIRVVDRQKKARDLEIDFSALEKRKRREYDKLDRMIAYSQTRQCRRAFLLGYFGDAAASHERCHRCDNCGFGPESRPRATESTITTQAGREIIMKALSGVARAKGRFGKTLIAQMLTGSSSEKMERWGLKKLSTYGLLSEFRQTEMIQILDALSSAGFVEISEVDRFRPVANLTATGWEVVRSQVDHPLVLELPEELLGKISKEDAAALALRPVQAPALPPSADDEIEATALLEQDETPEDSSLERDPLWIRLKALRSQWAREAKQPPYCIFSNQTLEQLVRLRPRSPRDLAAIKGLGSSRMERHGQALLLAISQDPRTADGVDVLVSQTTVESVVVEPEPAPVGPIFTEPVPSPVRTAEPISSRVPGPIPVRTPEPRPIDEPAPTPAGYVPTEEWTCRLLERGFSPRDAAAIRGLDSEAIIRHVRLAVRRGRKLPPESFIPGEMIETWELRLEHAPDEDPVFGASRAESELWELYQVCRGES
ncbi:RecQ family ATP-dependent DNA helicase [Singulisphaera sp. PoT]|uniref:RecQ family ATP-dependent DNA helicase n=1 Tax=Singulisphaera sp. PoT TaxID=3411797 RepID=UPI003BF5694E